MGDIFSIETRNYVFFREFFIDADGGELDACENVGIVKQWKCVPPKSKGSHPILTWQEMHTKEDVVLLDYD